MLKRIPTTPAFVGFFILQLSSQKHLTKNQLLQLAKKIYKAAGLKSCGKPKVDRLKSPIKRKPAYSINQTLKTSILSLDSWPEHLRIVILLHSCQIFQIKKVRQAIKDQIPDTRFLKCKFSNYSYYGY